MAAARHNHQSYLLCSGVHDNVAPASIRRVFLWMALLGPHVAEDAVVFRRIDRLPPNRAVLAVQKVIDLLRDNEVILDDDVSLCDEYKKASEGELEEARG
jgi:hypothetical protein